MPSISGLSDVHECRDNYEIELGQQAGTLLYNWEVRREFLLCCASIAGHPGS
jgi:hypothetical protein